MKVEVILTSDNKVIFPNAHMIEKDAENLYIYDGPLSIYVTTIPFKDIKEYHVESSGRRRRW